MKEYTGHYQIGGDNHLRMLSSKAVKKTAEKMEKRASHLAKSKALEGMKHKSWAETHGQKEGKQLKGTITGRKFGPKSY